jgi:hypothetical protein
MFVANKRATLFPEGLTLHQPFAASLGLSVRPSRRFWGSVSVWPFVSGRRLRGVATAEFLSVSRLRWAWP